MISSIFRVLPQPRPNDEKLKSVKIVAHRGVHQDGLARENSIEAFELAEKNNLWGIEFDIHFTKDHVAVISHDPHLGQHFNKPHLKFRELTFGELRKDVPQILTLDEVVSRFSKKLHFMIEIKEDLNEHPRDIEALKTTMANLQPVADYHLLSLRSQHFKAVHFAPKESFMDVIWLNPRTTFRSNYDLGHGAISGHYLFFTSATIARLQQQKKHVGVGFIDSEASFYREINRGVDSIFTNHPLRLKKYLSLDVSSSKG
jgi:glycerophosphoryl diester phosphodiesterase